MGQYYKTTKEFQKIITAFFNKLLKDPGQQDIIRSINTVLIFNFSDPDVRFTIDFSKGEKGIVVGNNTEEAEIKVWMTTDALHKIMLGKQNPMAAIMSREVRVVGPFYAMSNMVKIFTVASRIYREVLTENGMEMLIE